MADETGDAGPLDEATADFSGAFPTDESHTRVCCPLLGDLGVRVVRDSTEAAIARAEVHVEELESSQWTSEDGWVHWPQIEPGTYRVGARKDFYHPDPGTVSGTVNSNQTTIVTIPLEHEIIVQHIWQEWHEQAGTTAYAGPQDDDRRVVENRKDEGDLQAKERLHLCFLERAITTIEAEVLDGEVYYARWQIVDIDDNVVREHPNLSQANYAADHANARLQNGRHGWMWDGRDSANDPVFVASGTYRSRITVKDASGTQVHESAVPILAEGEAYRISIVGRPMDDADLARELADARYGGRLLDAGGRRIARDCWLLVWRGEMNDGHVVFLGKGTIEAQKTLATADAGAIATPHGRDYKGWVRHDPHGAAMNYDRVQVESLGRTDMAIALTNPGGPDPDNPYSDTAPNTPIKDGVQAHAGNSVWVGNATSVGCTTASAVTGSIGNPGSVYGALRSRNSQFGGWGATAAENVANEGPEFFNKQRKRNRTEDSLLADDHVTPILDPPANPPAPPTVDEPLHMQPTVQRAAFGGFYGHEIPRAANVADAPVNELQIRLLLETYGAGTRYHVYHRAVIFGHSAELAGDGYQITAWFPRKVIRSWNGNFRNVLVQNGRCRIAWYIEHRRPTIPFGFEDYPALHPAGGASGTWAVLPGGDIGRAQRTWTPPNPYPYVMLDGISSLPPGQYYSVIRYRLEVQPSGAADHVWVPEPAMADAFPTVLPTGGNRAQLLAETNVNVVGTRFLEGRSELLLREVT